MKNPLAIALVLLLALGGCLELDGQELTLRYDPATDRIDVLLLYRGLFAESDGRTDQDPLAKALKDLADARETGEFVLWNNWPLTFDLTRDYAAPRAALVEHVDVENGGLFTDPQGFLCAYQFVRIRDAKAFVQKVNTLLELAVQVGLTGGWRGTDGEPHQLDDDTREFVRDFLRSGHKMLVVEPGRVELRLPLSAKDHVWLKKQLDSHFLDNMPREIVQRHAVAERRGAGDSVTDTSVTPASVAIGGGELEAAIARAPSYRFFWDNDFSIERTQERTTIGLGVAGDEELHVTKAASGLYHPKLLDALRERQEPIEDGVPDQEIARRFAAFHGRDAVLPPKLAAKHGR